MPNAVQNPTNVGIVSQPVQVVIAPPAERIVVRLLETHAVETERREIVSIEEQNAGVAIIAVGSQGPQGPAGGSGVTEAYLAGTVINGHREIGRASCKERVYGTV